ncbi:hypothetical protein IV203_032128 [Nitzschia inconspicua]|uniref:Uncharacterized protein n=1 Tax=Nitzschia inconspicua TaxID=303405 RepID=A0A9K3Q3R0_9STRA|nr:hypothetical protein IV203_032128 [Nitzschia inconspicua]
MATPTVSSSWSTTSNNNNNLLAPDTNLGDIEKARLLLKYTNPNHPQSCIASVRVEEAAGKLLKARKLIQEGCQRCPTNFPGRKKSIKKDWKNVRPISLFGS